MAALAATAAVLDRFRWGSLDYLGHHFRDSWNLEGGRENVGEWDCDFLKMVVFSFVWVKF